MKIQTKRCVFNPGIQDWVLVPVVIEVNSASEFKAALAAFAAEVQRYQAMARGEVGDDDQA